MPGKLEVGERELELHPTEGHVADGMAIWLPWAKVLICGDFLSPVEIPMLSRGRLALRLPRDAGAPARRSSSRPITSYPATARCSTRVARAAILREDLAYLETLELPLARRSGRAAPDPRREPRAHRGDRGRARRRGP